MESIARKTIAVIVTYNRIELLKQCLNAVLSQDGADCDVLVVDNASMDGTADFLREKIRSDARLHSLHLPENRGGAGGFSAGISEAARRGYDTVWVMDDDTIPKPDALQILQNADRKLREKNIDYGFLSSTVLWTDGTLCKMNRQHRLQRKRTAKYPRVDTATFVSLLIPRNAIETAGLPIADYFIWGDDKEYTLRLAKRFPCYHIVDSLVTHHTETNAGSSIYADEKERISRYFFAYRNDLCTAKRQGAQAVFVYLAGWLLNAARVLLFAKDGKLKRLQMMFMGLLVGLVYDPDA